jgi:hypothetical protein
LDSVSRAEFHEIFDRLSAKVELRGATTPAEIEKRMALSVWVSKKEAESIRKLEDLRKTLRRELGKKAGEFQKQIWRLKQGINRAIATRRRYDAEQIDKLLEHDFAGRAIFEARTAPMGIISMTLLYGKNEAEKRILAQRRAAVRAGRAGSKFRTPEFRAALRGLR